MPRFKADLHLHTISDFLDCSLGHNGMVTPFECIDMASSMGYQVLSFTHHGVLFEDKDVADYASERGVLLIPGLEAFIGQKHVLLYNFKTRSPIDSFDDIRRYKQHDSLVIAPHPFYPSRCCLQGELLANIDCFDALEYSHYYTRFFNPNRKMLEVSETLKLPVVGFSDMHYVRQFGTTYSLIDAEDFSIESIVHAIKNGHVEVVTQPLSVLDFIRITAWFFLRSHLGSRYVRKNILNVRSSEVRPHVEQKK